MSYDMLPPGEFPGAGMLADWGLIQVSRAFASGFTMAAPFLVASLVYNVALGVINRAMPQLMVAFVGAPALTAGGLMLMFLVVPLVLATWSENLSVFLADPFGGGK
jgi:flagellar biosynthetic protein FliR